MGEQEQSRAYFPRGLSQPESGYRFSMDSLLLSCFCRVSQGDRGADLGAGCGVVGLGLLLANPQTDIHVTGVELSSESVAAADHNIAMLGLDAHMEMMRADVVSFRGLDGLDFVVANPPYRDPSSGRISRGENRSTARFEQQGEFSDFCACASAMLRHKGRFAVVHLSSRLPGIMHDMRAAGLEPKRLRMVHSRIDGPARMVLVEAVRGAKPDLAVEAPLILYAGQGDDTKLTERAIEFCPFLGCNAG